MHQRAAPIFSVVGCGGRGRDAERGGAGVAPVVSPVTTGLVTVSPVMTGLVPVASSVMARAGGPSTPCLYATTKGVDGPAKPGHDGYRTDG